MITSSISGVWADCLEVKYPGRGRAIVIGVGVTISTLAFLLHGMQHIVSISLFTEPLWHITLQIMYGASISLVFPVLDGLTIDFLERHDHRQNYGKERLHGPIWWAVASLLLSPVLDRVGFAICYPLAIVTLLFVIITLVLYDRTRAQHMVFAVLSMGDEQEAKGAEVSTQEASGNQEITRLPLVSLIKILVSSGCAFLVCLTCISSGQAVVDNLSFLFFEGLGSSWMILGLSVVVKIAFEVPVFYYGEHLLTRYGARKILLVGCMCYIARVIAYTYIPFGKVKYVLLMEPMHGITYGTVQIAMVEFAAQSLPVGNEAAGQGLVYFFRECGSVIGVALGGWAENEVGPRLMFRFSAVIVFIGSSVLAKGVFCNNGYCMSAHAAEEEIHLRRHKSNTEMLSLDLS